MQSPGALIERTGALNEWIVVETLTPGQLGTVIADGGRIKEWTALTRVRSGFGRQAGVALTEQVTRCATTNTPGNVVLAARAGSEPLRIVTVPVPGPFDVVHAVEAWVGMASEQVPPRRIAGGWDWDSVTQRARNGPDVESRVFRISPENVRAERVATDNFSRVVRFDDIVGYMSLCASTIDGERWQGQMSALCEDGVVRVLQMVARVHVTDAPRVKGFFHDISDLHPHEPLLDATALRAVAARTSGRGLGTLAVMSEVIYDWYVVPPDPLDLWLVETPEFADDDRELFRAACARMTAGSDAETIIVRLRFGDQEWAKTELTMTILSREFTPQALLQVTVLE